MHFVIVGCGAVGGYFGGRLAQHGENVTFIARGQQLENMKASGLTIESIEGDVHLDKVNTLDATSLTSDSLATPADVIFICVKSYQLSTAMTQIKPLITEHTRVIPLLNGVNAADIMQAQGIAPRKYYWRLSKNHCRENLGGVINHTGAKPHITLGLYCYTYRALLTTSSAASSSMHKEQRQLSAYSKTVEISWYQRWRNQ